MTMDKKSLKKGTRLCTENKDHYYCEGIHACKSTLFFHLFNLNVKFRRI